MSRKSNRPEGLWFSQNYLTSARTIERLLDRTDLCAQDHVIEIGPGKGHITRALLARCGRVTAVELDPEHIARLRDRFAQQSGLTLVEGDFLTWPLPRRGRYKVFANIPFHLTTAILRRLTQAPNPPEAIYLIVERGAALRFLGRPRESLQSLLLKPYYTGKIACPVSREAFHPVPRCDCALLALARREQPDLPANQRAAFERFLAEGLHSGGASVRRQMTNRQIQLALRQANAQPVARGEIDYIQWLCLFRWCVRAGR